MSNEQGQEREQDEEEAPWIIDAHTHILPARLASKIRAFFLASIASIDASTPVDGGHSPGSPGPVGCCSAAPFDGTYDSADDFPIHGRFSIRYHESDPLLLATELRRSGIKGNWVLPYAHKGGMASQLNADILSICAQLQHGGGLTAVVPGFTVHPADGVEGVASTAREAIKAGARVCKLHCSVGAYTVLDPALVPLWTLASKVRFPTVVHAGGHLSGNTARTELGDIEQLAKTYPEARIVLAHSASPAVKAALELARRYENVYLDTTPVVTRLVGYPRPGGAGGSEEQEAYDRLLSLAKQGRILLGTDLPNVALELSDQIRSIWQIFGNDQERERLASGESWRELRRDGKMGMGKGDAVWEVLCGAATRLVENVRSEAVQASASGSALDSSAKM